MQGLHKSFEIQPATQSLMTEYEFTIQNGNGRDYFQKVCAGTFPQKIFCKIENFKNKIFVILDRPRQLEININSVLLVNRQNFPAEKGVFTARRFLAGEQALNLFLKGLPTSSIGLKVKRFVSSNQLPLAQFDFSTLNDIEPSLVSFSALLSSDPDGTIASYEWAFGDQSFTTGALVQHIYQNAGSYTATLTVTDDRGAKATVSKIVLIKPDLIGPVLSNINPASGTEINANNLILTGESNEALSKVLVKVNSEPEIQASINQKQFLVPLVFLSRGAKNITITAFDLKNNQSITTINYNINFNSPPLAEIKILEQSSNVAPSMLWFDASGSSDADNDQLSYLWDFGVGETSTETKPTHLFKLAGTHTVSLTVSDSFGGTSAVTKSFTLQNPVLPVDPATIAPPIAENTAPSNTEKFGFLFNSENPIQKDADPAKFVEERLTPIRGKILQNASTALSAVKVTIKDHPEYGYTLSRENGEWDMAVNGGGNIFVVYEKGGYLSAQRPVDTANNIARTVEDVILVSLDEKKTVVMLNSDTAQLHASTMMQDVDGARQAQVLIPENTTAEIVMPDGSRKSVNQLTIRATEFTVGPEGPSRMPAQLPPRTGYTYAAEFNADEAIALGGGMVEFSKPVPMYVDNFLNLPTGSLMPLGFLNPKNGFWEQMPNAIVIKVLGLDTNQNAILDVRGHGVAATAQELAVHNITASELKILGSKYVAGKSFWRGASTHFSTYDFNGTITRPDLPPPPPPVVSGPGCGGCGCGGSGGGGPGGPSGPGGGSGGSGDSDVDGPSRTMQGCVITVKEQILAENIDLKAFGYSLYYTTDNVKGQKNSRHILLFPNNENMINNNGGDRLVSSNVIVEVAGKKFTQAFTNPNLTDKFEYVWDGFDVFGRPVYENIKAKITVEYVYPTYYKIEEWEPEPRFDAQSPNTTITLLPSRDKFKLTNSKTINLSSPFDKYRNYSSQQFNSWAFSFYHAYDPKSKILYKGDGGQITASEVTSIVNTIAGNGVAVSAGNNIPAVNASLLDPAGLAQDSAGNLYVTDHDGHNIRKIDKNNIITTIAGNGIDGYSGDGGLAINATIGGPTGIAVSENGTIYFADNIFNVIRKIDPNGIISTIAGNGTAGFSGDGGPATAAQFRGPTGLALGLDGSLYISDTLNNRIRRLWSNGIITPYAGTGVAGFSGDEGQAVSASLNGPLLLTIDKLGNLYIADELNHRIRKVAMNGIISTIAGNGIADGVNEENIPATEASLRAPIAAVGNNGEIYITDENSSKILKINTEGKISTIIGTGFTSFNGDNKTGIETNLGGPRDILVDSTGAIIFTEELHRVRKYETKLPSESAVISSTDGSEIYYFNAEGLHLKTLIAETGAIKFEFTHDTNKKLQFIKDSFGLITQITRDSDGNLLSMTGPFGQTYNFTVDANNYLSAIVDPLGNTYKMSYTDDGLMTSFKKPEGNTAFYEYNVLGKLTQVTEPDGGVKKLTELIGGSAVEFKTGEDVVYIHERVTAAGLSAANEFILRKPDGGVDSSLNETKRGFLSNTSSDGYSTISVLNSDPWFVGQARYVGFTKNTYTNLSNSFYQKQKKLAYTANPDGVNFVKTIITKDNTGSEVQTVFDSSNKTIQTSSIMGRSSNQTINAQMQTLQLQASPEFLPVNFSYNTLGQLTEVTQGDRITKMFYDQHGFLSEIIDPENRNTKLINDAIGRTLKTITPDSEETKVDYDKNSNIVGITPPQRLLHRFVNNVLDLVASYTAPGTSLSKTYQYDFDKRITKSISEESSNTDFIYGSAHLTEDNNKLINLNTTSLSFEYGYHPASKLLEAVRSSDQITIAYNRAADLLLSKTYSERFPASVQYTYNPAGLLQTSEGINNQVINQSFDLDKALIQNGDLIIERSASSVLPKKKILGNFVESISYSTFGEISLREIKHSGNLIFSETYSRDKLGRITQKNILKNNVNTSQAFSYDLNGRLKTVSENGVLKNTYNYDAQGNRLSSDNFAASYNSKDRLISYTKNAQTINYNYSEDDSLVQKNNITIGTQTTYRISQLNALQAVEIVSPSGTKNITYWIDGENKRSAKLVNGIVQRYFIYDKFARLIAELAPNFSVKSRFVYATQGHSPDYMIHNGQNYYFLKDQLGSILQVLNSSGVVIQDISYDEFGIVLSDTNPGFQPFGFAGGHYDFETGLVRFGARDYDAEIGRWLVRDPIGFNGGDTNLFAYVNNDPVNFIDPEGKSPYLILLPTLVFEISFDITTAIIELANGRSFSEIKRIIKERSPVRNIVSTGNDIVFGPLSPIVNAPLDPVFLETYIKIKNNQKKTEEACD